MTMHGMPEFALKRFVNQLAAAAQASRRVARPLFVAPAGNRSPDGGSPQRRSRDKRCGRQAPRSSRSRRPTACRRQRRDRPGRAPGRRPPRGAPGHCTSGRTIPGRIVRLPALPARAIADALKAGLALTADDPAATTIVVVAAGGNAGAVTDDLAFVAPVIDRRAGSVGAHPTGTDAPARPAVSRIGRDVDALAVATADEPRCAKDHEGNTGSVLARGSRAGIVVSIEAVGVGLALATTEFLRAAPPDGSADAAALVATELVGPADGVAARLATEFLRAAPPDGSADAAALVAAELVGPADGVAARRSANPEAIRAPVGRVAIIPRVVDAGEPFRTGEARQPTACHRPLARLCTDVLQPE